MDTDTEIKVTKSEPKQRPFSDLRKALKEEFEEWDELLKDEEDAEYTEDILYNEDDIAEETNVNNNLFSELKQLEESTKYEEYKNEVLAEKESTTSTGEDKPRFSLIPQAALEEVARVLTYGAKKYPDFNYSKPQTVTTYLDAAHRHINKFLRNEDIDDETKTNHLANAIANLMITLDSILLGNAIDDRNDVY